MTLFHSITTHSIRNFLVASLLAIAFSGAAPPSSPSQAAQAWPPSDRFATTASYLELSVKPAIVLPGQLVTLYIVYHNLGEPYTNISIIPAELAAFDPPMDMPCKYYEQGGCTEFSLRALAVGTVEFRAGATGEIFDEGCNCWRFWGATDNGPARLVIAEAVWQEYLPLVHHVQPGTSGLGRSILAKVFLYPGMP
jgi:hypothetical protein